MQPRLTVFYEQSVGEDIIEIIVKELKSTYEIEISKLELREINDETYNRTKYQYNGQKLLNQLIDGENLVYFFWVVDKDLYVPGRNFVFGLATQYYGAIVSFFRLKSTNMKIKESIHECGHVLGLGHCREVCVMQYSKNLDEALLKPAYLCWKCKKILRSNEKIIDENKD